ncbi:hypothetical protein VNO77_06419 [Canavalia gladiata]|uniref:ELF3-like protein 2 n=1 Tax=Canavalia gladiata TaxID=3824 RepID=A0AAN9MAB2_CANGL
MRGGIDEGKEISPMFPRLHVKDADKGGPKAPPRNKMALYEQFSIPSQNFASRSSLFSLSLRNCTVPTSSSHVGSSQNFQFCTSNAPYIMAEKIQPCNSRKTNLTKLMQDDSINNRKTPDDGEDAFITSGSAHGKNSCCSIIQNDKDEDKIGCFNLSSSVKTKSQISLKKGNSSTAIELKSAQYGKNQMQEHTEMSLIGLKPKEGPPQPLDGFGDMTDTSLISLVKGRKTKAMSKEHRSLKDEIRSISVDSLKTFQGSSVHTHEEHAAFGDKINLRDRHIEKSATSDIPKCHVKLEIGKRCFLDKGDGNEDEETYRNCYALNKASPECTFSMDISPDNIVGVIGEKQFWKARRTMINQQKIFAVQVFELHRLIKVQRLIAGSPHILVEDNPLLNKPQQKTLVPNKSQSDLVSEQPSLVVKLDSKSAKAHSVELAKNNAIGKIPIPYVNYISKGHANQLSDYGHPLGNLAVAYEDINSKQCSKYIYPAPGNQWLVPVMSPSEGLVYKPIIGPCPPNAGFMAPIYGTMSFNPGNKDDSDSNLAPGSHQKFGILSSTSLPQFLPPPFMHSPSISASPVEQTGQSNGSENHHSCGEVNSGMVYQNSSNMSSHTSQAMPRNISSMKDKELQRSTASSPSKRMKRDVLPLFPVTPDRDTQVEQDPRVIKAMPHNPKSATESAARIFRSIQDERKHL